MQQISLTFFQFYYLLKYYLFKLLLYNPQARELIVKKCSEDIIFWLEFFVKLPPSQNPANNQDLKGFAKGVPPFAHSLYGRGVGIEKFLIPETKFPFFKYQKDYILEIKSRIENGQPLVVQESINMGSQTCTALTLLWFWLYKEDSNFFILGRVIKELYKTSDPNTTFMMYKYVLDHLPDCLYKAQNPSFDCHYEERSAEAIQNQPRLTQRITPSTLRVWIFLILMSLVKLHHCEQSEAIQDQPASQQPTNTQNPPTTCNCSEQSETATKLPNEKPTNTHTNQQSQLKKDFRDPISPGEIFFKNAESDKTSEQNGKATEGGLCDSLGSSPFLKGLGKEDQTQQPANTQTNPQTPPKKDSPVSIGQEEHFLKDNESDKPSGQNGKATKGGLCDSFGQAFFLKGGKEEQPQQPTNTQPNQHERSVSNLQNLCDKLGQLLTSKSGKKKRKKEQTNIKPYKLLINRKKKFLIKLVNPYNGNTISGFTAARRYYFPKHKPVKAAWLNNFAFQYNQTEHYTALKNISKCLITTSVPNGNGNEFYNLSRSKQIERYKLHWTLNPYYNEQWYNKILKLATPEVINQFLNIDYDYKLKRQRKIQLTEPTKQAAKKVETVSITVKSNRSSFFKTFAALKQPKRSMYHKKSKYTTPPLDYEKLKSYLIDVPFPDINFPSLGFNYSSKKLIYQKWYEINKMIHRNTILQVSSQKTALKLLYHFSNDFSELPLPRPFQPPIYIINSNLKSNYTQQEMETLFPSLKYINREIAKQALKAKNNRPKTEQEFLDELKAIAPLLFDQETDKPAPQPQNSHCEEQSDEAIQNKPAPQKPQNTQPNQPQANTKPDQPTPPPQRFIPRTTKFIIKIVPPKKKNTDNNSPNTNNNNAKEPDKPP